MMTSCMLGYLILSAFLLRYVQLKECNSKSLGLRDDDGLPYYYFQGTSYSQERSKKHINKNKPQGATWCPDKSRTNDSFLEVDLNQQYSLCGVSTQGDINGYTKSYKIKLSSDRIYWKFYQLNNGTDKVFDGNKNSSDNVTHKFVVGTKARFVRFYPTAFQTNACIRVELYGERILKEICEKTPINVSASGVDMTSRSDLDSSNDLTTLNDTVLWCWSSNISDPHLKVDLRSYYVICGMQLNYNGTVHVMYSDHFTEIKDIFGSTMYVQQEKQRILTTFITLKPMGNQSSCLTWKIFGYSHEALVNEDIGLQYGNLTTLDYFRDGSFDTSAKKFHPNNPPSRARLYKPKLPWCNVPETTSSYLELVLVKNYYIFAVSFQGRWSSELNYEYAMNLSISYSDNYMTWQTYPSQYAVNFDDIVEKFSLNKPIEARVVRINIPRNSDQVLPCLRVELHGVAGEKSVNCRKPSSLGLSEHQKDIPDNSLTVSSERFSVFPSKENARLWRRGCWCGKNKPQQWINIDFGQLVSISGVATQGCSSGYTMKYKIKYSYDRVTYYGYDNDTYALIFQANSPSSGEDTIFANWLDPIVTARHIKVEIQEYENFPCLRLEVYGCKKDIAMPKIQQSSAQKLFNRTKNTTITLNCDIRGQAGMVVVWKRDGTTLHHGSTFETIYKEFPKEFLVFGMTRTQINITYNNDWDIYDNFKCTGSRNNSRRLTCRSVYSCSASYPGATTPSKQNIPVTVTPTIVLPDIPGEPSISHIKTESAVISWQAADDYLESRLESYIIDISCGNHTGKIHVISGIQEKNMTYHLLNLTNYTSYSVKIAAVNGISTSNFTETLTFLTLYGPYVTVNEPSLKIVQVNNRNIIISCTGTSYPTPHVTWKKNGTEIIPRLNSTEFANDSVIYQRITYSEWDTKSDAYLVVTSKLFLRPNGIQYEDHGKYTCEVLNANESSQPATKTVEIQFPPRITKGPRNITINEGDNVTLTCDAEGPPKPTFTWKIVKKNVTIENRSDNNNKLEFKNVRSNGLFHLTVICIASNKGGNSTASATIEIFVKPRITYLTPSKTELLYDNVTLSCEVLANPSARIWWTKDGSESHRNNVRIENDNKTLVITKAVLNNIGKYSCNASSNLSSTSKQLTLNLKAIPKAYIIGGEVRKLKKGQKNSRITCLGYGYPDPKVTWKINDTEIPEKPDSSIGSGTYQKRSTNYTVLQNVTSVLYFNQSGSTFEDFGNYTCEVSIKQEPETASEVVEVIFYPIVTTGPSNVTALQNKDVRFDCKVDGRPIPETSWLFKNASVFTNHSLLPNRSLLVYSVKNTKAYEGEYSCFAKNEAGRSEKSSATLIVHVPTRISNISKTEVHQLKDNVTLTCDAEGDPPPSVYWMKQNTSLTPPKYILLNDNQSLTIMNVSLDEQGTYICKAMNEYASDTRNVTVNVQVRPEAKVNSSSAIYLKSINEAAIIHCSGRGYPVPVVSWYKDGEMISTNSSENADVYQVIDKTYSGKFLEWISTILFVKPDATHSQFGNYTCNATKLKDNERDLERVEIVLVPTVAITKYPNTSTVLEGTDVTFTCTANGAPKPTIFWSRLNGTISTTKSSEGQNVLMLTNVTNKDEGVYVCTAHNRGKPVEKQAELIVHVKPRILQHMENDDVQNGTSHKLNCSAYGDPALAYSWSKNGDKNIANAVLINENKTLHVNPVTIDNEGIYKCVVKNVEGNASTTANITVFARPTILNPPVNSTRNETQNAIFSCVGNGIPTPRIIWKKNGVVVNNSTKYDVGTVEEQFNIRKSNLKISNLEYADRGSYSCTLKNRKDKHIKTAVLEVQVQPSAKIDPNLQNVKITNPVTFTCNVYGFPQPEVSWMKSGVQIENSTHYSISNYGSGSNLTWYSNLTIDNVKRDDTANYSCFLRNAAGTDRSNVLLVVLERPDPLYISFKNVTSRSVLIKWKANFDGNRDILNYSLVYFINGSQPNTPISLLPKLTSYNVKFLKPFSNYTFEITAANEIGISDVSSTSTKTLEDRPTRPRSVGVVPLNATSLNVSWLPPEEENGVIRKYVVYYQRVGHGQSHSVIANANERSKVIVDLKPYTNYSIEVVANTSAGYGNKSTPMFNRTHEAAPSSPRNIMTQVESNTTIQVSWLPPQYENGIIVQYGLRVREHGVNSSGRMVFSERTNASVSHLKPFTNYTFRVRARTNAGWGNFSAPVSNRTDEGLPSEPMNFTANVTSNTTVLLSWTKPLYPNGIIRGYHVYYKKTKELTVSSKGTSENETQVNLNDLTPYTNYTFWIHARTSAGIGNKSETNPIQTHEGVPTYPRNVEATALKSTCIRVNWSEPRTPNGIITKYVVYYRKTLEENGWKETIVQNEYSTALTSLNVFTDYSVAVQAFTSAGGGSWSETTNAKTLPGIPVRPTEIPIIVKPTGKEFDSARMIAITLPRFSHERGKIRSYKIIVVMVNDTITKKELRNIFDTKDSKLMSYDTWIDLPEKIGVPYIAFVFDGESYEKSKTFIIGNKTSSTDTLSRRKRRSEPTKYKNGELIPDKKYAVAVRGYTAKDKYVTSEPLRVQTEAVPVPVDEPQTPLGTSVVVVIVVVVVVLSFLFLTAVWFKMKKSKNRRDYQEPGTGFHNLGHPVPLPEFRFYIQSKQFGEEFQDIPKIVDRETTAATSPSNMPKNRYKNIIPYDYTRVRLNRDEGDDDTDYVNASFIKGLNIPSKYIATQGPLPNTASDFWKMVWDNEVSVVVMLTGLEENGTVKCYQYWPASSDEKEYGSLTIKITGETVLSDFTTRYFELKETATGQIRLVQHLHFTAWPDHGVPKYAGPLLHFHRRYRSALSGPEPVVVHCSAGCGRTGTFIALDYILHKLEEEKHDDPSIDILHFVRQMRGQRVLMVQTEEQYRFIHHAVLEAVTFPDTEISSTDIRVRAAILRETIPGKNKTKGKEVFENLQKRIVVESCEDGSSSDNQKKNRSQLLPFDYNRVPLKEMQNKTDYINATFICGYQYSEKFIATQHPLPNTVNDFWRMLHEQKSAVVLAITTLDELNEFGSYWPEEGYTSYGPINVAFEGTNNDFAASGFLVRKFKLTDTRDSVGRSFAVTHFHFVDWSRHNFPTASSMLRLLAEVEKAQRSSGSTLVTVHCSDGGGRTGTFCAIASCIERVKVESNIDLPMTVRNLQAQRMGMIENEAQYIFCYDVVAAFLTSFDDEMYDNFKKKEDDDEEYPETSVDDQNRLVSKF